MGQVIAFRRKLTDALSCDAVGLYAKLAESSDFTWRGGWAEVGENGEIALHKRQHCIGFWLCGPAGFSFYPTGFGETRQQVKTTEDAYRVSLNLVERPLPDSAA